MSSSGVRDFDSTENRIRKIALERQNDKIQNLKPFKEIENLSSSVPPDSNEGSPSGNYMKRDGDEWLASFGNEFDVGDIDGGFVNVSKTNGLGRRLTILNGEGGLDDFLDTLNVFPTDFTFLEKYIRIANQNITLREPIIFTITNIVGTGVDNIVTVTVSDIQDLVNDDQVQVTAPGNFSSDGWVKVSNVTASTFDFDLGKIGSATPETSGSAIRGNLKLPNGEPFVAIAGTFLHFIFDLNTFRYTLDYASNGLGIFSEPIELGFNEVVTQTPPTKTIIAGDQFNPSHMDLDQDVELQLDTSATTSKYKSIFLIIDTTGGGFTVTFPASVANPPIIDDSVAQRVSVILYTLDNGVTWTHATSTGSSTSAGEFFGPWTGTHDADDNILSGLRSLDFFQAGHAITNKADPDGGLLYDVNDLQAHIFRADLDEIARFEESAGGVFRLDMLDHSVENAKDYRLNANETYAIPGSTPGIGFDDPNDRLRINVPVGSQVSFEENSAGFGSGVTINPASGGSVTANVFNASDVLQLGVNVTAPTVEGEFRNDGNDTFVFSGGVVRNFSDIGAGSPLTTKGDIFGFDVVNARIPVGTDGQILTANSLVVLGVEWQTVVIPNSISQGDSDVTVTDVGSGLVAINVDGDVRFQVQELRVDFFEVDIFGLETLNFDSLVGGSTITPSTDGVIWNYPDDSDDFEIRFGSVPGFNVNLLRTQLLSNTPNTVSATLSMFRDDPSPGVADALGDFDFDGRNSVGDFTTYATMIGAIVDPTNGSETGRITTQLMDSGTNRRAMRIEPGSLTVNKFATNPGSFAELKLIREDVNPSSNDALGEISYIVDNGAEIPFTQIRSEIRNFPDAGRLFIGVRADNGSIVDALEIIGDDNNALSFMNIFSRISSDLVFGVETGSTDLKMFPGLNQMGIVVQDNVAFTVGNNGSIALPHDDLPEGTPTKATLDAEYGTHKGCIGFDRSTLGNSKIFVREDNGDWSFYSADGKITV